MLKYDILVLLFCLTEDNEWQSIVRIFPLFLSSNTELLWLTKEIKTKLKTTSNFTTKWIGQCMILYDCVKMTLKKRYLTRGAMPSPNKQRQVYGATLTLQTDRNKCQHETMCVAASAHTCNTHWQRNHCDMGKKRRQQQHKRQHLSYDVRDTCARGNKISSWMFVCFQLTITCWMK